jgi:hypothetical protein
MSAVFALVFGGLVFVGILGLYEAFFRPAPVPATAMRWHVGLGIEGFGCYVAGLTGLIMPSETVAWLVFVGGGLVLVTVGFLCRSSAAARTND